MIKAVVLEYDEAEATSGRNTDKDNPPSTLAGEWYEYTIKETCHPQETLEYKNEARLDDEGKPYIYSWKEITYDPTYEKWCAVGYDHHQKILGVESFSPVHAALYKKYEYTRKVLRGCWIAVYADMGSLEKDMKQHNAELSYGSLVPGIDFEITFNE